MICRQTECFYVFPHVQYRGQSRLPYLLQVGNLVIAELSRALSGAPSVRKKVSYRCEKIW